MPQDFTRVSPIKAFTPFLYSADSGYILICSSVDSLPEDSFLGGLPEDSFLGGERESNRLGKLYLIFRYVCLVHSPVLDKCLGKHNLISRTKLLYYFIRQG